MTDIASTLDCPKSSSGMSAGYEHVFDFKARR